MCIRSGIPAIVCRFEEQSSKGLMWRDIGLDDWLFDMDKPEEVDRIVPTVLALTKDPEVYAQVSATDVFMVEKDGMISFCGPRIDPWQPWLPVPKTDERGLLALRMDEQRC